MTTQQLLIRVPEELASRLRRQVPARQRSAFIQRLLEQALPPEDGDTDPLYLAAVEAEHDNALTAEMAEWDSTVADGLMSSAPRD